MAGREAGIFSSRREDAFYMSVLLETNLPFWIFGYQFPQMSFPELGRDSDFNLEQNLIAIFYQHNDQTRGKRLRISPLL